MTPLEVAETTMIKSILIGWVILGLTAGLPTAAPVAAQPAAATTAVQGEALPLAPGFWESRASAVVINGSDRRCLRASDIERYVHGWSNSVYACTYPVSTVSGGQVVWQGTCSSRGGRHLRIEARGTYTQTSFRVTGRVTSRLAGINLTAPFTMTARRLGECSQFPNEPPPRARR